VFLISALLVVVAAVPPVGSLGWLPADTVAISGAPRDQVSLLKWLRETAKTFPALRDKPLPGCWDRVTKRIVASYQIWTGAPGDEAAVLAQGPMDRARAESCIAETSRTAQLPLEMTRKGAVTQFDAEPFGRTYVGWTPSWVVWHPQRERVEALLAALPKQSTISPALAAAIARVDRSAMLWGADTRDYSRIVTGVPNRSWTLVARTSGSTIVTRVAFEYASGDDARRAAAAVAAAGTDPKLPPELQALARSAQPTVRDRFVDVQLDAKLLVDERTLPALQSWLERKRAGTAN
jgi:hypothetical protein